MSDDAISKNMALPATGRSPATQQEHFLASRLPEISSTLDLRNKPFRSSSETTQVSSDSESGFPQHRHESTRRDIRSHPASLCPDVFGTNFPRHPAHLEERFLKTQAMNNIDRGQSVSNRAKLGQRCTTDTRALPVSLVPAADASALELASTPADVATAPSPRHETSPLHAPSSVQGSSINRFSTRPLRMVSAARSMPGGPKQREALPQVSNRNTSVGNISKQEDEPPICSSAWEAKVGSSRTKPISHIDLAKDLADLRRLFDSIKNALHVMDGRILELRSALDTIVSADQVADIDSETIDKQLNSLHPMVTAQTKPTLDRHQCEIECLESALGHNSFHAAEELKEMHSRVDVLKTQFNSLNSMLVTHGRALESTPASIARLRREVDEQHTATAALRKALNGSGHETQVKFDAMTAQSKKFAEDILAHLTREMNLRAAAQDTADETKLDLAYLRHTLEVALGGQPIRRPSVWTPPTL